MCPKVAHGDVVTGGTFQPQAKLVTGGTSSRGLGKFRGCLNRGRPIGPTLTVSANITKTPPQSSVGGSQTEALHELVMLDLAQRLGERIRDHI